MADIRESFNDSVGSGVGHANSALARARATSSDRMSDQLVLSDRHAALRLEVEAQAKEESIPTWAVDMRDRVKKPGLVLCVKNNGDLYYRDHYNCKYELPSSAKQFPHKDGMLLADFLTGVL